jgi:hypothetical protein
MKSYRKPLYFLLLGLCIILALMAVVSGMLGILGVIPGANAGSGFIVGGSLTAVLIVLIHDIGVEIEKSGDGS